ncbi:uncharacterized protein LOC113365395 [Ctenocephalides felis]|uniref:uncharacterized protein LOC113365395 n=1 Tax=Ctenocephalides felis TaxID=7515 RepID=UPI000E6E20D4|nr:uncharacterized protein LOC113365395 [Ctenocephalides felis]
MDDCQNPEGHEDEVSDHNNNAENDKDGVENPGVYLIEVTRETIGIYDDEVPLSEQASAPKNNLAGEISDDGVPLSLQRTPAIKKRHLVEMSDDKVPLSLASKNKPISQTSDDHNNNADNDKDGPESPGVYLIEVELETIVISDDEEPLSEQASTPKNNLAGEISDNGVPLSLQRTPASKKRHMVEMSDDKIPLSLASKNNPISRMSDDHNNNAENDKDGPESPGVYSIEVKRETIEIADDAVPLSKQASAPKNNLAGKISDDVVPLSLRRTPASKKRHLVEMSDDKVPLSLASKNSPISQMSDDHNNNAENDKDGPESPGVYSIEVKRETIEIADDAVPLSKQASAPKNNLAGKISDDVVPLSLRRTPASKKRHLVEMSDDKVPLSLASKNSPISQMSDDHNNNAENDKDGPESPGVYSIEVKRETIEIADDAVPLSKQASAPKNNLAGKISDDLSLRRTPASKKRHLVEMSDDKVPLSLASKNNPISQMSDDHNNNAENDKDGPESPGMYSIEVKRETIEISGDEVHLSEQASAPKKNLAGEISDDGVPLSSQRTPASKKNTWWKCLMTKFLYPWHQKTNPYPKRLMTIITMLKMIKMVQKVQGCI